MKGREAAVVSHTAAVENVDSQRAKLEGARSKGRVGKIPELEAKLRRVGGVRHAASLCAASVLIRPDRIGRGGVASGGRAFASNH